MQWQLQPASCAMRRCWRVAATPCCPAARWQAGWLASRLMWPVTGTPPWPSVANLNRCHWHWIPASCLHGISTPVESSTAWCAFKASCQIAAAAPHPALFSPGGRAHAHPADCCFAMHVSTCNSLYRNSWLVILLSTVLQGFPRPHSACPDSACPGSTVWCPNSSSAVFPTIHLLCQCISSVNALKLDCLIPLAC